MKVCVMLTVALVLLLSAMVNAAPAEDLQKRGLDSLLKQAIQEVGLSDGLKKKLLSGKDLDAATITQLINELGLSDDLKKIVNSGSTPNAAAFRQLLRELGLSAGLKQKLNAQITKYFP